MNGGIPMKPAATDPRVDAYIEKAAPFAQPVLRHLRKLMHQACPHATESLKWGMPFFEQQGVILANMAAFKQHCAFGFWGTEMKKALAKNGLQKSDAAMGWMGRITGLKDLPSDKDLLALMRHAGELVESGQRKQSIDSQMRSKRGKRELQVPAELSAALKKNKLAAKAFAAFPPGCRHEYAEWIAEAKRPETKQKRVAQAIRWIAEGKSRNWQYEKRQPS
jgi:uncharacterized protein YdeI (YjbR/CyaY-like superfamily)